ncbi:MAG TPA: glycine betaine ABC transporter substrate-binding protein, partial [Ardenticatenaceae bacterium]
MNRKSLLLTFILVLALALAACGGGGAGDGATEGETGTETTDTGSDTGQTGPVASATAAVEEGTETEAMTDTEGAEGEAGMTEGGPIRIASKGFTEAFIIGEMYALLLESAGFTVERNLGLGTESVIHEAMLQGDIDLYPEYTSTGLLSILQMEAPSMDRQQIYTAVKEGYEEQFDITWLDPAPFNNTQALAVTQETSDEYGLTQVSQLVELAPELRVGGPPEFFE